MQLILSEEADGGLPIKRFHNFELLEEAKAIILNQSWSIHR